jgi:hypothetical protein
MTDTPGSPWAELVHVAAAMRRIGDTYSGIRLSRALEAISGSLDRLGYDFDLLPSQRERDLAYLFHSIASAVAGLDPAEFVTIEDDEDDEPEPTSSMRKAGSP